MGFEEANLVLAKVTHLASDEGGIQTLVSVIPVPMMLTAAPFGEVNTLIQMLRQL